MNLLDLDPHWYTLEDRNKRVGFTFDCPHCKTQRLGIAVHDEGHRIIRMSEEVSMQGQIWNITDGTDFHDITIFPSIDASGEGHWHGFITNGKIS